MKAVETATDLVVKDGGVIHEDAMWDANEMALDGESTESIARRIRKRGRILSPSAGHRSLKAKTQTGRNG